MKKIEKKIKKNALVHEQNEKQNRYDILAFADGDDGIDTVHLRTGNHSKRDRTKLGRRFEIHATTR